MIRDCLESVAGVFHQIVFVDTGSTDRTMEIAHLFGVELYEAPWEDSFAAARNVALSHATGDWLFWLDADDVLPPATAEAILNSALHAPLDVVGFVVPVQFVSGDHTRVDHVKLFRNLRGLNWDHRIHEQILPSLSPQGKIGRINACVLHQNYDTTPEGQAKKRTRDEKLLALDLQDHPDHPFAIYNVAMTHHFTERHEQAIEWFKKCLSVCTGQESHVRKVYALLSGSLRALGDGQGALAACQEGLARVGEDPELRFRAGQLLAASGRYAEAKEQFLLVGETVADHYSSINISILGARKFHQLGDVSLLMDDYGQAKTWLRKAIEAGHLPSAILLFEAAMNREDLATAREACDALLALGGPTELWVQCGMDLEKARGGRPESFLFDAARRLPHAIAPAILCAKFLMEAGQDQEAESHLRFLEDMGSAEGPFLRGIAAIRRQDWSAAFAHNKRALELDPEHEAARQQLTSLAKAWGPSGSGPGEGSGDSDRS